VHTGPASEALVNPVPTIVTSGQYQKPYYHVQAGQNGSTNPNSRQGTYCLVPSNLRPFYNFSKIYWVHLHFGIFEKH